MAWYDDWSAGILALAGVATTAVVGLGNQLLKTRRMLAQQNSEIQVEKSDAKGSTWLNEQLMEQVTRSEARHEKTIAAAREVFKDREVHIAEIARLTERLANSERESVACQDRAQRAETRAAIAEEHMRVQTEQILIMGINIDRLTSELKSHDPAAAERLSPRKKGQPLLVPPSIEEEGPS